MVVMVAFGIWYTHKQGKVLLNSAACPQLHHHGLWHLCHDRHSPASNPPIDMNNPENVFCF